MEVNGWLDPCALESYVAPVNDTGGGRVGGDDGVGPRQRAFELDAFTVQERMWSRTSDLGGEDPDLDWRLTQVKPILWAIASPRRIRAFLSGAFRLGPWARINLTCLTSCADYATEIGVRLRRRYPARR
jgi:hypothetical protein